MEYCICRWPHPSLKGLGSHVRAIAGHDGDEGVVSISLGIGGKPFEDFVHALFKFPPVLFACFQGHGIDSLVVPWGEVGGGVDGGDLSECFPGGRYIVGIERQRYGCSVYEPWFTSDDSIHEFLG